MRIIIISRESTIKAKENSARDKHIISLINKINIFNL